LAFIFAEKWTAFSPPLFYIAAFPLFTIDGETSFLYKTSIECLFFSFFNAI